MNTELGIEFCEELASGVPEYTAAEWAYFEYAEILSDQIFDYMERNQISKADLARKLACSRAYITKVLRGDVNLTLKTLTQILHAIGAKPMTKIVPTDAPSCWENDCWRKFKGHASLPRADFKCAPLEGRAMPTRKYVPVSSEVQSSANAA